MISLSKLKALIPASHVNRLAVEYQVNSDNHVRLPGQTVFLCVLNGILNHPILTQRLLEEQYKKQVGRSCDHSSFGKRLANISADYFRAIFDLVHSKVACLATDSDLQALKLLVLMTNLPLSECRSKAGPYSFEEIVELYRRRWEIEVFFKLLKQHLNYAHLTSRSENGIKVMILMSMIASLLMIWYRKQAGIDRGWRSVKFWLAEDVRTWTAHSLRQMQVYARTQTFDN